jgi:hypothetical protein
MGKNSDVTLIFLLFGIVFMGGVVVGFFICGTFYYEPPVIGDNAEYWYMNIYEYQSSRQQVNTDYWVFTPQGVLLSKGTGTHIIFEPTHYEEGQILNIYVECDGFLPVVKTLTLPSLLVEYGAGVGFGKNVGTIELIRVATPTVLVGVYDMVGEADLLFAIDDVYHYERFGVGHYVNLETLTEYVGAVLVLYLPNGAIDPYLSDSFALNIYTMSDGNGTIAVFLLGQLKDTLSFRLRLHYAFPGEVTWHLYHEMPMADWNSGTFGVPDYNGTVVVG